MVVVNGFLGMRHYKDGLLFNPHIPSAWTSYKCRIAYRDAMMEVQVGKEEAQFTLITGDELSFRVSDKEVTLTKADSVFYTNTLA